MIRRLGGPHPREVGRGEWTRLRNSAWIVGPLWYTSPCNSCYTLRSMPEAPLKWTILVYRIPAHPTRLRLQVWRKLQRMGALYLQNAACILPARPDLDENMQYVAAAIEEMGGAAHLFTATMPLPGADERIVAEFRALADGRLEEIAARLDRIQGQLDSPASPSALERAEEELKRERIAYLRARRLAYFGSAREADVDSRLEELKRALDDLYRSK